MVAPEHLQKYMKLREGSVPAYGGASPEQRTLAQKALEERERYEFYYAYIRPFLEGGMLDFKNLAEVSGLPKERKIRDTLMMRVAGNEMIQLLGRKEGVCYLCNTCMRGGNREPSCLLCLESIVSAIRKLYTVEETALDVSLPSQAPGIQLSGETVPKVLYDTVLRELNEYRAKYGPLELPPKPPNTGDAMKSSIPQEPNNDPPLSADILKILDSPDLQNDPEPFEALGVEPLEPSESLRHFGFQRLKHQA